MTSSDNDTSIMLKPSCLQRKEGIINQGFDDKMPLSPLCGGKQSDSPDDSSLNSNHSSMTNRRTRRITIMHPEGDDHNNEQRDSLTSLTGGINGTRRSLSAVELASHLKELRVRYKLIKQ